MADEHDDSIKVVDRRWWARGDDGGAPRADRAGQKPTYVEELERRTADAEKQAQEYLGKYRQASQEFEDARARMRKELAKDAERSRRDVLVSLIEVVDNLDRAIDAAKAPRRSSAQAPRPGSGQAPRPGSGQAGDETRDLLLQGVEMVQQQFLAKLDGFGVKRIDALGAAFDPSLHEAVTAVPAPDAASDGRVMGVITHGYRIGDEVLRPALVAVGKTGEPVDHT
jgi:molecular chaperone GrpE